MATVVGEAPTQHAARAKAARFLVIEDDPQLAEVIRQCLVGQACIVEVTHSGRDGEQAAASGSYDGILLDLMLPDHDGVELCRNLRRQGIATPILMLTALESISHKVTGLNAGADDYLTKPFELDELIARVQAILRRAQSAEAVLRFHDVEMNLIRRTVQRGDKPITLTAKEFALLEYFMRNPNRVITRTSLSEKVWDMALETETNVVEVYVSRLRRKMDKGFDRQLIHTVIGMGYTLSTEAPS